jgi:hypothetical protein
MPNEKKYIDINCKEMVHLISNLEPRWKPMNEYNPCGDDMIELNSIVEALERIPAADVVEVVRCKDCKYERLCCTCIRTSGRLPDDYCSRGELKDGDHYDV